MKNFNCKHCGTSFDNKRKLTGHSTWCKSNPKLANNLKKLDEARSTINSDVNYLKVEVKKECKWCGIVLDTTRSKFNNHLRWCDKNPTPSEINLKILEKARSCRNESSIEKMKQSISKAHARGAYEKANQNKKGKPGKKLSDASKNKISKKRKQFLKNNPDKHPWKNNKKFISAPCEHLKSLLKSNGIEFKPEKTPLKNRAFSLDIAFPKLKLAIEVNGNQHYNKDGTLKEYYQTRHDLIEACGWKILELYYKNCYSSDILDVVREFLSSK